MRFSSTLVLEQEQVITDSDDCLRDAIIHPNSYTSVYHYLFESYYTYTPQSVYV